MIAHRGLKTRGRSIGNFLIVIAILMIVAYLIPAIEIQCPWFDSDFRGTEVERGKIITPSLYEIFGDNGKFNLLYFGIVALILTEFIVSVRRGSITIFTRFVAAVLTFYIGYCLFILLVAAFDAGFVNNAVGEWFDMHPWFGIWLVYLSFGLFALYAYIELLFFYKWYPVQTLFWSLFPMIYLALLFISSPLGIMFGRGFVSLAIIILLPFAIMAGMLVWKGREWNASLRDRIARKNDNPIYLGESVHLSHDYDSDEAETAITHEPAHRQKAIIISISAIVIFIIVAVWMSVIPVESEGDGIQVDESVFDISNTDITSKESYDDQNYAAEESNDDDFEFTPKPNDYDDEYDSNSPEVDNTVSNATVLTGKLDGRYEVVVQFIVDEANGNVSGTYYYTKYKSPISLSGRKDGDNLTLNEYTNGNLTGQFIGRMSSSGFDGVWQSADGTKVMDCTLHPM